MRRFEGVPLAGFRKISEEEIQKINRLQRESFDEFYYLFEPPLPEGVPERLEKIVDHGKITGGDTVLDVGTGTGILIPIIKKYEPSRIYACDLSNKMLEVVREKYPFVQTIVADVRDIRLPDQCLGVVYLNACYPNVADKRNAFLNLNRMLKTGGRIVISHPMGREFISGLKKRVPYPLDEFPAPSEAPGLFNPFGFDVERCVDEARLYILVLIKKSLPGISK